MPIVWPAAAAAFEQILREHGIQPTAVTNVEAAWRAFVAFSQTDITGVVPADEDGDGLIVQWGRRSWYDNRLSLALTRQLAVANRDPQLWQVELAIAFDDEPALLALEHSLDDTSTDFRFDPIGPPRANALAEMRAQARQHALVRTMWTTVPVSSTLTFDRAC
jgi:hypothetical protein